MAKKKGSGDLPVATTPLFAANEKIDTINVADEMKNSFLDYSMSVIISRALPDARDGLKPSQRRILMQRVSCHFIPGGSILSVQKFVATLAVIIIHTVRLLFTPRS